MPDVKIFVDGQLVNREVKEDLLDEVPAIVAEALSCHLWSRRWPFRTFYQLDPEEIDVMIFWDDETTRDTFDVYSNCQIIVEVAAYDFRDRRRSITKRITSIARSIKGVADKPQNEDFKVTISFIPIKIGYWAKA